MDGGREYCAFRAAASDISLRNLEREFASDIMIRVALARLCRVGCVSLEDSTKSSRRVKVDDLAGVAAPGGSCDTER